MANILISACLLGINCKYTGDNNCNQKVLDFIKKHESDSIIPICPEQLGGLPTPRSPYEIMHTDANSVLSGCGKVQAKSGEDVTMQFINGANECLKIAQLFACSTAILKDRSPSCGTKLIHNGDFNTTVLPGKGITAQLLSDNGIQVFSEDQLPKE